MNGETAPPKSLLVVRLGSMGDVIHTIPAVAALRNAFPEVPIGWIVEHRWAELLYAKGSPQSGPRGRSRPLVDFVHIVDTKLWRKSLLTAQTRKAGSAVLREVRETGYEVAADFQGALKSAVIARLAHPKTVFGMKNPREWPAQIFYTRDVQVAGTHVVDQYHSLAEAIAGRSLAKCAASLPQDEQAKAAAENLVPRDKPFVLINPGAGWAAKQWPGERYGEVAKTFASDGLLPCVHVGPGEEKLAQAVTNASGGAALPLSCSLGELIALTRRARLFIAGDTGPLHLAAALQVPVVAIFGPTDPARNGPYGTRNIVLRNPASRTSVSHVSTPDPGLLKITTEEVVAAARRLLEESPV